MMLPLFIWMAIFAVSLFVLIKASGCFTASAEKIGLLFGFPPFIVGVTIVAFGTSLPEIVSSIIAVSKDSSEIVIGNVVGSNIANIFFVFGIAAIVGKKMRITYELIRVDLPFLVGSAFLLTAASWDGSFTWPEGLLCITGVIIYLLYTINTKEKHMHAEIRKEMKDRVKERNLARKTWVTLFVGAFLIYLSANYVIEAIIRLSNILNLGKEIIAVSAVALGTSLPELTVSVAAVRKNKPEIAVGNILGSNIFNSLAVMGIPSLIGKLTIPDSMMSFGLPVMLMATLLYVFITQDKEISRWEGWLLLIFYLFFIGKLFNLF
jgi:cation:H+ antiporter